MSVALSLMRHKCIPVFKVQVTFFTVFVLHVAMTKVVTLRLEGELATSEEAWEALDGD